MVAFAAVACGRTEPWPNAAESEESTSTSTETGEDTTESETSDTASTDVTDDGTFIPEEETDTGIEPKTCRDMLECILGCVGDFDPACFAACGEGADPAEMGAALALMGCIVGTCVDLGQCSFQDFSAEECVGCIGLGLFLPTPPGCEAEAQACQ